MKLTEYCWLYFETKILGEKKAFQSEKPLLPVWIDANFTWVLRYKTSLAEQALILCAADRLRARVDPQFAVDIFDMRGDCLAADVDAQSDISTGAARSDEI